MRRRAAVVLCLAVGAFGGSAAAQNVRAADQTEVLRQLDELRAMRMDMQRRMDELDSLRTDIQRQMGGFDQRIGDLERQLDLPPSSNGAAEPVAAPSQQVVLQPPVVVASAGETDQSLAAVSPPRESKFGDYAPGKGFVLASGEQGELAFSAFSYARYLNQQALEQTYTDAFGRTSLLDLRNDVQLQKVTLNFKGWLLDPRFTYLWYVWTSNTSQGDLAQVVVGGKFQFEVDKALILGAGIEALPSTRTTSGTFPLWLRNDHRTIADEFFRGSYTTGIWARGDLSDTLSYHVMLGNNLSQLGVNASQLDAGLNTASARLWWMPTTGEYGAADGFGDFEHHERMATLFGVHFTHSREDAQAQPGTEGFENAQLRLSDGTLIFRPDPFGTGGVIREATYDMLAVNAGAKYQGYSFDIEAYFRWLSNFQTVGVIPVTSVSDQGLQVQASAMLLPSELQAYLSGSKIWGDYGNPWDMAVGLTWYPFKRREFRINGQALYLVDSPVGYSSVPFPVGGNGWVFSTDVIVSF